MILDLFNTYSPVLDSLGILGKTILGSRQQSAGFDMQIEGYRQAASSTLAGAEYNNKILEINTQRRLDALGRQIQRIGSEQRVAAVSSGFASSSKSKLAVMDATLDQFARQIRNEMTSLGHAQTANLFEAETKAAAFETSARNAEYSQKRSTMSNIPGILSAVGGVATSIGGLF